MTLLALLLAGCPETQTVVTQGGANAKETIDRVKVSTDLAAIRLAIKLYAQEHEGQNAPDLAALGVQNLYYADKYVYDSGSGTVSCPEAGM